MFIQIAPTTVKGQVTIPKEVRDVLGIEPRDSVVFKVNKKNKTVKIVPATDILDLKGKFAGKMKDTDVLAARNSFESNYSRA